MTNKIKGIPDNSSRIIPGLVCTDGAAEIDFCVGAFDAVIVQPQKQFWGVRIAWIMDPAGHVWTIATRIEETTAEKRSERRDAIVKKKDA